MHHWYLYDSRDSNTVSAQSVTGIIEDRKGRYWCTTWGGGFDAFDPRSGKFRSFKVHAGTNSISTNLVGGLFEDSRGILYMGSDNGGLITFDPDSEKFKVYRHDANDPSSISCDFVEGSFAETKSTAPDHSGSFIWLTTNGGGINAFDPLTGKFRAFTTRDGLSTNDVVTIVKDNNGDYWLGIFKGISCFTPPKDPFDPNCKIHFRNYDVSDGLPADDINNFATYKDIDGRIFFGTYRQGMFCFYPQDLKDNEYLPPVFITDFRLFNQSVIANDSTRLLSSPIEDTKQIELSYRQNVISFTFASLNYIHPEKNQYAYKLDGFDRDWTYTDASKRFANYTNLNAGEYTFEVKGSNNDGVWNETPTTLHLIITPPYWQTWWFRMLLISLIGGIIYALVRNRMNQVVKLQRIRNKIASDLHDDVGSTLSSISIFSELAKQQSKEVSPLLDQIGEHSRKMLDTMADIVWTINPENDNFEKIILRMRSFAYNLLGAKNIAFEFDADESINKLKLPMEVRKNLFLIFKEAANNMAKYSEASRALFSVKYSNHQIKFMIRDNGNGFDEATIERGNGLNNMKRRAKEIGAQLLIESGVGSGTSVELILQT
ncbi:MAG: hypothetical protein H0W62_01485 [Chitinophagales bacterium]|nr:hypothetical protein [Chitinophagales bacterium]